MSPLLGAGGDRKITPGVLARLLRESSSTRRIGSPSSSLPILGSQQNPRARLFADQRGMRDGFRPSRDRSASTCWVCWLPEGKAPLVREERGIVASSLPVVRQGTAGQPRYRG